jgi:predicted O-methyltransferase YrrM
MNRIDIINGLIKKNGYKYYLEIGVQNGHCFSQIEAQKKTGVDPDKSSAATVHKTSDEFFKANKYKFDIIFIDGLHHADQVVKDINNSLACLNKGGAIVMHDCLPTSKRMQEIPLQEQCEWTGDTWKAFVEFRKTRSELTMHTVDTDWGCGIITIGAQDCISVDSKLTYENYLINKKEWLNVISVDKFKELYL